jgi:hypothetical protein
LIKLPAQSALSSSQIFVASLMTIGGRFDTLWGSMRHWLPNVGGSLFDLPFPAYYYLLGGPVRSAWATGDPRERRRLRLSLLDDVMRLLLFGLNVDRLCLEGKGLAVTAATSGEFLQSMLLF